MVKSIATLMTRLGFAARILPQIYPIISLRPASARVSETGTRYDVQLTCATDDPKRRSAQQPEMEFP